MSYQRTTPQRKFGLTFTDIQLGVVSAPAQIVTHGFPSDQNKGTNSVQMVLKDPASSALSDMEGTLEVKARESGFTLNSSVIRTVTVDDVTYPVIRCKFGKDSNNFQTVDPWNTGGASVLDDLTIGHQVLTICKPVIWSRNKECGITLYANAIKCVGCDEDPIGQREREAVEWQ